MAIQNDTLKESVQAGQFNSLFPGRGLIRSLASHPGHWISTLTTFLVIENIPEQEAQVSSIGLFSEPATTTVVQCGH